jgi:hypothetical protein
MNKTVPMKLLGHLVALISDTQFNLNTKTTVEQKNLFFSLWFWRKLGVIHYDYKNGGYTNLCITTKTIDWVNIYFGRLKLSNGTLDDSTIHFGFPDSIKCHHRSTHFVYCYFISFKCICNITFLISKTLSRILA